MTLHEKRFEEVPLESLFETKNESHRSQSQSRKSHSHVTPKKSIVPLLDLSDIVVGFDIAKKNDKKLSLQQILLQQTDSKDKNQAQKS